MATKNPTLALGDEDIRKLYFMSHWAAGSDGGELLREWIRTLPDPDLWHFEGPIDVNLANTMAWICREEISRGTDLALARFARLFLDRLARGGTPQAIFQGNTRITGSRP